MNYKVGDKVRVKKNLKDYKQYGSKMFAPLMRKYCGKVYEIKDIDFGHYHLVGCSNWSFTDKMLEPVRQTYTLQECIDKDYAIHCDTEDKANKLLKALDSEGYKWKCGSKYTFCNYFSDCGKETCYTPYEGMYGNTSFYKEHNIKIVWFDCVVLPQDYKDELASVLDDTEKAYLEAVLRPFKNRVVSVKKDRVSGCGLDDYFYLKIEVKTICHNRLANEVIGLPFFKKNLMYKGMVFENEYTLQELGLFTEKQENKTAFDKKFDEKKKSFGKEK